MADGNEQACLSADRLSISFGGLQAVSDLSFSVARGEIYGLLGPNGAGKTTALSILAGSLRPESGRIGFFGENITRLRPDQRARRGIGRTFQITRPFVDLTVEENVMVGMQPRYRRLRDMHEECLEIVGLVGLDAKRKSKAAELSTGQRKRLELARALATSPKLLLMDEVTGGVDLPSVPRLVELVGRIRDKGVTVILIEHSTRVVRSLCDRVLFMDRGRAVAEGTPAQVFDLPSVKELYLGKAAAHA